MMTAIQAIILCMVAAGGTAVAVTRDPLRQAFVAAFYGMLLAILFLMLQAPDVAFSEIAVGTVILPVMVLLALAKVRGDFR